MRTSLGVYVLGAIEPAERSAVEAHLSVCPFCRDELAGLASLPALLGRVDEAQIAQVSTPPEPPLEALIASAAAQRHGRIRRWAPRFAAAVFILFVGVLGGIAAGGGDPRVRPTGVPTAPSAAPEQVSATDPKTHVTAQVGIDGKAWGTAVAVRVKGAPPGTLCRFMAVGKDGRRDVAAAWQVVYSGSATFYGSTMITRDELKGFEIRTLDGRMLLTIASPR
ncbi:anti-sigma factor family protein [Actinomadura sp. HBU206391]|uniref:anti-sigma factor family protein n=1 Tax=Actinomadura sp. HBU206391 TaxID=2731692 RepID=UPI0016509987|nr:zf-HC2 domain-containing protein [Actinomadura sp. HBU206391]MBC6457968.1 zf-HC2 domain-containing protein [Actinomadura sp. HBU206391]